MDSIKLAHNLPPDFWMKTGIFVGIIVGLVLIWKLYQRANKVFLGVVLTMVFGLVFFSWVYNRNEPAFLTPVIERIAVFFPTKGYEPKTPKGLK